MTKKDTEKKTVKTSRVSQTRAKTEKLKSGFLRIAKAVEGQIFLGAFDFANKRIFLDRFYDPSGNIEEDLLFVRNYFMQFQGNRPENY